MFSFKHLFEGTCMVCSRNVEEILTLIIHTTRSGTRTWYGHCDEVWTWARADEDAKQPSRACVDVLAPATLACRSQDNGRCGGNTGGIAVRKLESVGRMTLAKRARRMRTWHSAEMNSALPQGSLWRSRCSTSHLHAVTKENSEMRWLMMGV